MQIDTCECETQALSRRRAAACFARLLALPAAPVSLALPSALRGVCRLLERELAQPAVKAKAKPKPRAKSAGAGSFF